MLYNNMECTSSSMYLFDQTDELIQFSSLPYQDYNNTDQQDNNKLLYISYPPPAGTDDSSATKLQDSSHRRRKASSTTFLDDQNPNENKKKKAIHRDIERQRRQEMATLYKSLRSQLPTEHLKGKRSISDHMHEAVNYIKHLKKKMEELKDKKDGLKTRLLLSSSTDDLNNPRLKVDGDLDHCLPPSIITSPRDDACLTVKPSLLGVEVVISTDHLMTRQGLQLSKVLKILNGEGLNVVNCISTKIKERLLHTIESEVNAGRNINLSDLQQKLLNLTIGSPS